VAQAPVPPLIERPTAPLRDGSVVLRLFDEHDVPRLLEAAADPAIPRLTNLPALESEEWAHAWLERVAELWREGARATFAVADAATDELLGSVGLRIVDGNGQIGYWVLPAARGRGIATRALRLVCDWAFSRGFPRLQLLTEPENDASQRVAERAGFRREGLLRNYFELKGRRADGVMFGLLPNDPRS
jgi:RimJ/RimL family protein N-acetyltransferase